LSPAVAAARLKVKEKQMNWMRYQHNTPPSLVYLPAHKWLGLLSEKAWLCHERASILRPLGYDPACPGCRTRISYDEVVHLERYVGPHMLLDNGLESMALQLDIIEAAKVAREVRNARS
jgi:hypothetical protein